MINMIFLMVDIIIFVPPSISHSMIYGRLVYHGKVLDFPSVYHNVMGSSLPSFSPPLKTQDRPSVATGPSIHPSAPLPPRWDQQKSRFRVMWARASEEGDPRKRDTQSVSPFGLWAAKSSPSTDMLFVLGCVWIIFLFMTVLTRHPFSKAQQ